MQDIPTTGAVAMSRNVWGSNQQIKVIAVLTSQINQPGMCRWIGAKRTEIPSTFFHIFSQLPILLLKTRTAKNLWEWHRYALNTISYCVGVPALGTFYVTGGRTFEPMLPRRSCTHRFRRCGVKGFVVRGEGFSRWSMHRLCKRTN